MTTLCNSAKNQWFHDCFMRKFIFIFCFVTGNNYSRLCNPSPDSAIHSFYSPTQSPVTSRHGLSSSPCTFTPSLSRNNSDASQYDGSQHSSCYSYRYVNNVGIILTVLKSRNLRANFIKSGVKIKTRVFEEKHFLPS